METNCAWINNQIVEISDLSFDKRYYIGATDIGTISIRYCDSFGNIKYFQHDLGVDGDGFNIHIVGKLEDIPERYKHIYTLKSKWIDFVDDDSRTLHIACDIKSIEINLFKCGRTGLCIYLNYDSPLPEITPDDTMSAITERLDWFERSYPDEAFGQKIEISKEFDFLVKHWLPQNRTYGSFKFWIDSILFIKKIYKKRKKADLFYKHFCKFCNYLDTEQFLSIVPFI